MKALGATLMVAAFIGGLIAYIGTAYLLFVREEVFLALLAIFVPPADLILAFVAETWLGVLAWAAIVVYGIGGSMSGAAK